MSVDLKEAFGWSPPASYVCVGKPLKLASWDHRRETAGSTRAGQTSPCIVKGLGGNSIALPIYDGNADNPSSSSVIFGNNAEISTEEKQSDDDSGAVEVLTLKPLQLTPVVWHLESSDEDVVGETGAFKLWSDNTWNGGIESNSKENCAHGSNDMTQLGDYNSHNDAKCSVQSNCSFSKEASHNNEKKDKVTEQDTSQPSFGRRKSILYMRDIRRKSVDVEDVMDSRRASTGPTFLSVSFRDVEEVGDSNVNQESSGGLYLKRVKPQRLSWEDDINSSRRRTRTDNGSFRTSSEEQSQKQYLKGSAKTKTIYYDADVEEDDVVDLNKIMAKRRKSRGAAFVSFAAQKGNTTEQKGAGKQRKEQIGAIYLRGSRRKSEI